MLWMGASVYLVTVPDGWIDGSMDGGVLALTNERPRCEPGDAIRADLTRRHRQEQTERRRPIQGIVSDRAFSAVIIVIITDRSAGRQAGTRTAKRRGVPSSERQKEFRQQNAVLAFHHRSEQMREWVSNAQA